MRWPTLLMSSRRLSWHAPRSHTWATIMLLALDLAGVVGWCCGEAGSQPQLGAYPLHKGSQGGRLMEFETFLAELLARYKPDKVVMEAAIRRWDRATCHQHGLAAYAHGTVFRSLGISPVEVHVDTARNGVLGRCRLTPAEKTKQVTLKDIVMAWAHARGWEPPTHDAADAALIWVYMTEPHLYPYGGGRQSTKVRTGMRQAKLKAKAEAARGTLI